MRNKRKLLLLLSLLSIGAFAQNYELKFEFLTPNDGLSQATVSSIIEDERGFMWFGTRNGLNRYDGYTFTKYYNTPGDTNSLAGDLIVCLYQDKKKNIWIGTNEGFCMYNKQTDAFRNFKYRKSYPSDLKNKSVGSFCEDKNGKFWIGYYGGGLVCYNPIKDTYKRYQYNPSIKNSLAAYSVHSIMEDSLGSLWVGTDGGLSLFNSKDETFTNFYHNEKDPKSIPNNLIWSMTKDSNGNIWFGTLGGGVSKLNILPNKTYAFENYKPATTDVRRLKILSVCSDNNNGIWIGLENGGLDYFNTNTLKFAHYSANENSLFALNSNSVQTVYSDKQGNLWAGTYTGGVNVNKINRKKIQTFRNIPGNKNSLSFNAASSFYKDKENNLWIGTDGGGVDMLNGKTRQYTHFNMQNSGLLSDAVLSVRADNFGNIWVGGWECGLNRFDKNKNNFVNLPRLQYSLPNNNLFDIEPDEKGNLWIAFGGGGFGKLNYKLNTFKQYEDLDKNTKISWIFDLAKDKQGNILLGLDNGFSIFDPIHETFKNYAHLDSDSTSLSHNLVNIIYTAKDSTIWIGTSSGLNRFDPIHGNFKRFFAKDGLPNNNIVGIEEDKHGNIWISTNNGISMLDPRKNTFKNISYSDGLQGKGFIRASCYKSEEGEIYFGGTSGFNIINPDSIVENQNLPRVVINSFSIFNKPVKIGGLNSPLNKHINECDTLVLNYKHSVFSFEFAALDFTSPSQNQYAYLLEGFDKDWNYVGTSRTATYTNLDPGTYILRIKASNNDGKWTNTEKILTIIITPPFWKTLWFNILTLFIIILSITLFIRFRTKRLKYQNETLEEKVGERTLELENRTKELQETTELLEEKQKEVNMQNEEIIAQRDNLADANSILTEHKNQIEKQNEELNKHRFKLETLVDERTKELELALYKAEESDRLKSSFLSNMSHEIRTPLNSIIGFASLLNEEDITESERKQFVNIITKNGESLLVLINDILDLSKIQANKLQLSTGNVKLSQLLTDVFENLRLDAERKKIKLLLDKSCLPDNFVFEADFVRLKQVLNNLIANSLKFTEHGSVEFGIKSISDNITFFVKDTGVGIPSDTGNAIFNRFLKLENNKNVLYGGTGLGLAICKNLIDLWGGEIHYESTLGEGTTFWFTHPIHSNQHQDNVNSKNIIDSELAFLTDKVILIAEDEENNYRLLTAYLKKSNAHIYWVKNGKEAVDFVENNKTDIVLMDIKMPIMNGLEATQIIKTFNPDVPIIAQTAFAYEYELQDLSKLGIDDFLVKPLKSAELFQALKKQFEKD